LVGAASKRLQTLNATANLTIICQDQGSDGSIGFFCPGEALNSCFGKTGTQILNSVGGTFPSISGEVDWGRNCAICLAIGVFFKIAFSLQLVIKCREAQVPKAPSTDIKLQYGDVEVASVRA